MLYADPAITHVLEKDWLALVHAIAAGDEKALRVLFEKTYPLVFAYLMRLTGDRGMTEDVILEIFEDIWCEAPVFDDSNGPVLGWIVRQARSRAFAHARSAEPLRRAPDHIVSTLMNEGIPSDAVRHRRLEAPSLQAALDAVTTDEREAIEAVVLDGLSYDEMAARRGESVGTIKKRIRSGLSKLREALQEWGDES